ncbi:MAG: 3-methyl-2-oxobutanoate hydroxymethyltransferase [Candidatus Krumholzibacteria bacterium]|jgi:3-methyl-2-oxobutanoate hydroxymethyltransferase|nr:3-methyl-2-oxobutanoate hydroxymethyltransferase [Candidatus Krumholzibacteria bacterium]
MKKKVTTHSILKMKRSGEKIAAVTSYDFLSTKLIDETGIDLILVGDSLGMVIMGYENTIPVTMEEMIHHLKAVTRAKPSAMVAGDMPFMSYQASVEDAVRNAGRLVKEGGAESVKLEGGRRYVPVVEAIVHASIPVIGHLGLTPQSLHQMGGYRIQGRDDESAARMVEDAVALEKAGCYSIVLEGIPSELAQRITERVSIPTIGIGAGANCDGQVLVLHDMLGIHDRPLPRFVKVYDALGDRIRDAVGEYVEEVKTGKFPSMEHTYVFPKKKDGSASGDDDNN